MRNTVCSKITTPHPQVVELISTSISDFMEAEFIGVQDTQSNAIPTQNMAMEEWAARNYLAAGSLMAKSCQATLVLAGHSEDMQQKGFEFGKQIAYSWQVGSRGGGGKRGRGSHRTG